MVCDGNMNHWRMGYVPDVDIGLMWLSAYAIVHYIKPEAIECYHVDLEAM